MANTTFSGPVTSTAGFVGDVTGNIDGNLTADTVTATGNVDFQGTANIFVLPDADPGVAGAIWNNSGNIDISAG
jgi:hypothetical protein